MAQRPDNFTLNASHTLANGLVFAGLGAHAGSTRYHDSSAYGNHGALVNMDSATDWNWIVSLNRIGLAFEEGSSQRVTLGSMGIFSSGFGAYSFFARLDGSSNDFFIGEANTTNDNTACMFRCAIPNYSGMFIRNDGGTSYDQDFGSVTAGSWNHYAVVFNGTNSIIYLNGVQKDSDALPAAPRTCNNFSLGAFYRASPIYGSFACSDVMCYSRPPEVSEIKQLADPSNVMLSGLINYPRRKWWPVVSGAAPTFKAAWATKRRQTIGGGVI